MVNIDFYFLTINEKKKYFITLTTMLSNYNILLITFLVIFKINELTLFNLITSVYSY